MASLRVLRQVPASARAISSLPNAAPGFQARFASSQTAVADPQSKAKSLIEALPGNSIVSKTGIITLGTAVTGLAISSELYVVNEETIILGSFALLATYIASAIREPYREWADGQISKISGILNDARTEHTSAVRERIDTVNEMQDVVGVTKGLFALSKETAKLEHEAFTLRQKVALSAEIKSTLDSWVRYEAQARDAEQKELVNSVMQKVLKDLEDPKMQKDILAQAVADIESMVKAKKL